MGIGLFVLGQSISYARRSVSKAKTPDTSYEQSISALRTGLISYRKSFTRFISSRSALIHPEVLEVVDEDLWVARLTKRATLSWWFNMTMMPVAVFLGIFLAIELAGTREFLPVSLSLLLTCVIVWYSLKYATLLIYLRRIDGSFAKRGFDMARIKPEVKKIVAKMISDQREADRKRSETAKLSRVKKKEKKRATENRLFGADSEPTSQP